MHEYVSFRTAIIYEKGRGEKYGYNNTQMSPNESIIASGQNSNVTDFKARIHGAQGPPTSTIVALEPKLRTKSDCALCVQRTASITDKIYNTAYTHFFTLNILDEVVAGFREVNHKLNSKFTGQFHCP